MFHFPGCGIMTNLSTFVAFGSLTCKGHSKWSSTSRQILTSAGGSLLSLLLFSSAVSKPRLAPGPLTLSSFSPWLENDHPLLVLTSLNKNGVKTKGLILRGKSPELSVVVTDGLESEDNGLIIGARAMGGHWDLGHGTVGVQQGNRALSLFLLFNLWIMTSIRKYGGNQRWNFKLKITFEVVTLPSTTSDCTVVSSKTPSSSFVISGTTIWLSFLNVKGVGSWKHTSVFWGV